MSGPAPSHRHPGTASLFINGLGLAQLCSWGTLFYSFPLIAQAMSAELGWSRSDLYGAATLGLGVAALAAYPVGAAIDNGHGRLVMTGGSLLAGLLLMLWSQAEQIALFYLAVTTLGVAQAATLYDPAFAVVARKAGPAHARGGITALTMWGGFASTVFIPIIQLLIDATGWRGTLLVLGAINILVAASANYFAIESIPDAPRPPASHPGADGKAGIRAALAKPAFWALAVAFTAYTAMFFGFTFHAYPLLLERGFDTASVVAAIALIGPAQVAGRLFVWVLAPRAPVRIVGCLIVGVFPAAFLALKFMPPDFAFVTVFALAFGAVNGIITIVRGLVVPELITRQSYGAVNAILAIPATVARALAPVGLAMVWTATGSYDAVLVAVIVAAFILAIGFWVASALAGEGAQD